MKVEVRAFAQFRELIGRENDIEIPEGATLQNLLEILGNRSPRIREALFENDGSLREYVILMRNRKRVDEGEIAAVTLQDGDDIAVFPPVAGG